MAPKPKRRRSKYKSRAQWLRAGLKATDDMLALCEQGDIDWLVENFGSPDGTPEFALKLHLELLKLRDRLADELRLREVNKKPASPPPT